MDHNVDSRMEAVAIVRPVGRLDLLTADDIRKQLAHEVGNGRRYLVIDLSDVVFIDSSGLGALVSGLKAARTAGGDLRIASPNEQAKLILDLTTLNRVLKPYATVEEALTGYV